MKKVLSIFLTISLLLFVSCGFNQNSIVNGSLSAGFSGDEDSSPFWVGFTSNKAILDEGDNLALMVYYGTILSYPDDYIDKFKKDDVAPDEIRAYLLIRYGQYNKELMHKGKNIFEKSEYTLNYTKTGETVYKTIEEFGVELYPMLGKNSQYEEIVLSSDSFCEEMGCITFSIKICGVYQGIVDKANSTGNGKTLYYKNNNGLITLYDSYYNFFNSIIR